jgi:ABC-type hemin transport system substrate-binding protein
MLNIEGIIATNPDHVLLLLGPLDKVDPEAVKKRWRELPINAAKNNHITVIQNDHILIPSQRVSKTIPAICEALQ